MRTIFKSFILASLLLASLSASAQKVIVQDLESWMSSLITQAIENKVVVDKNFGQERDIQKEGNPLKWRCDIMTFTLPKKQRIFLEDMIRAFEENGHHNPNCYGINSKRTGTTQAEGKRNLMIGEDPNRYVTIGESSENYININILDASDTTKTHRYAYALEWQDGVKGKTYVRYIVTYAKIPSAFTSYNATVKYPSLPDEISSFIKERSRNPKGNPQQAPDKAQAWFLSKGKAAQAKEIMEQYKKQIASYNNSKDGQRVDSIRIEQMLSLSNGDTVFVVTSKINGENGVWLPNDPTEAVNDMLCNDNILLMFSNLKNYYLKNKNTELTAISIYTLCKHANEANFFTDPSSVEELEQLMHEVDKMIEDAKTETDRKYFKMALYQLDQILRKHK
ncbi:MAG: hypothetical protein IKO73_00715 [Bacteroidaceae bacterium]|nr:hypothetical protein [Bacteroidaceae bacterium]